MTQALLNRKAVHGFAPDTGELMGDPFNSTKTGRPFAQDLQRWLRQLLSISADINHSTLKERSDRNNRITGELFNAYQRNNRSVISDHPP